ncbi:MAG: DNA polymerase III subunit [Candidatus Aegiribacteria sp.]|nr:DNA polymerase III subunit [Candidatus Aegiribacteria sp.]
MGLLKIVRGQDRADELLSGSFSKGRLSHAYLFAGPSGVGRLTAALELAATWMCEEEKNGYCGECRNCLRVFRFQHPDVRLTIPEMGSTKPEEIADILQSRTDDGITPVRLDGNTRISISQIRELRERLSMKAYEDKGHIEIIPDADRMGVEAANALLKTLEEPPDDTVIVLISSRWSALLPTVRSRSHLVRFRRIPDDTIRDILMDRLGLGEEEASDIARSSDGRPGIALLKGNSPSSAEGEYGTENVLRGITEYDSARSVIALASEVTRKLGRTGTLEFCRSMQTFIHDLRRGVLDKKPVVHSEDALKGFSIDDEAFGSGIEFFRRAEIRLAGNGMPGIVLAAAFTCMWKSIVSS